MPGEAPFELPPIDLPIEKAIFDIASIEKNKKGHRF
jgi:hypothetical protein